MRSLRSSRSSRIAVLATAAAAVAGLAVGAAGTANAAAAHAGAHPIARPVRAASPWLAGNRMPQASAFHWVAQPKQRYTTTGEFQWLYMCGTSEPTRELHTSSVSVEPFATKAKGVQGAQILFHFSSTARAEAALAKIESDYRGCASRLDRFRDERTGKPAHARVDRTARLAGGVSYRVEVRDSLGRPAELLDAPSDAQEFFVQRGSTVSFVSVDGSNRHIDVTRGSLRVLRSMAARLG